MSIFLEKVEKKLKSQQEGRTLGLTLKDLPSPSKLKNCELAAKKIIDWLMEGKRMLLVGDYDADGIMATTIVMSFLREAGFSEGLADYLIPSRLKDGYGVSPNIVEYAKDNYYDFIVTVDNGIAAVEAIDLANKYGIPVIVTDHHTAPKVLPNAEIIVNPRVPGETFPFTMISGATVAWYLVASMRKYLNLQIDIRKWLDFVAITIISDVMPLDNINLPLLKYGMELIKKQKRFIYELIWNEWSTPTINTTEISFSLVPKINAIGRIDDANLGVKLFMSKKREEIKKLYEYISEINETRKNMSRRYTEEAEKYLKELALENNPVIIVRGDFHEGVVGIIAGKLAEKYQKPAYVFSFNKEKQVWKGSGRSVGNIYLYDLTNEASEFIAGFGGHKGAVGLAVKDSQWDNFVNAIIKAGEKIPEEDFKDESLEPINCSIGDINMELIELLKKYAPYGHGNPEPVFLANIDSIEILREMKGGLHFKGIVREGNNWAYSLFFNVKKEEFLKTLNKENLSIIFYPSLKYNPRKREFSYELISTLIG